MQNKANSNFLYFIYGFTLITAILYVIALFGGIFKVMDAPNEISIPVNLKVDLENEGHMQYDDKTKVDITFSEIQGRVVYKENNPVDAPILWSEIFFPFTRIALLLFAIVLTMKIMQTSMKEEPFIQANAYRLEGIGLSLIFMGLLKYIEGQVEVSILERHIISPYFHSVNSGPYEVGKFIGNLLSTEIPIGLFTLFIAALFKHGIAIREENALTI